VVIYGGKYLDKKSKCNKYVHKKSSNLRLQQLSRELSGLIEIKPEPIGIGEAYCLSHSVSDGDEFPYTRN
jgi:hypothetical protein